MAEDKGLCTHYRYHKHKIVLFLSAMRSHADSIAKHHKLIYYPLDDRSYEQKLDDAVNAHAIDEIVTYEIEDHFFEKRIENYCQQHKVRLDIKESPGFLTSRSQFRKYNASVKKPFMHTFYQQQRKRLGILVDENQQPLNGKWSFDEENRKKLPKGIEIPAREIPAPTPHTEKVCQLVEAQFPDHPGKTENFGWATTREQVLVLLESFLNERFQQFGPYEDAIDRQGVFLFHSVLSPYINMGLITSAEVVERSLEYSHEHEVHFPSVEGFVRQLIGWREFIRGIYQEYHTDLKGNFFNHQRKFKPCWYEGTTGIPPLDDSIKKAGEFAYTHHIERLMVLGNIMLLCELHPDEVYKWFMEMYIDSADWVMVPNIYGMSQFADGGIFATKPYVAGSNYILKMSNYTKKGEWPETVNGLYWRFIDNNRALFNKNPRMSMMTRTLDKMDSKKKMKLFQLAEAFIARVTIV